jgi:predicted DNA binding CopG/RHH family protein
MEYINLDKEERDIVKVIDADDFEFKSIPNVTVENRRYRRIASEALRKTKNVNIRLSEDDVLKIKAKALRKGLPYQTLISSVLHQYGNRVS